MKRKYYLVLIFVIALTASIGIKNKNPNRSRETYIKILSKDNFFSRLQNAPLWMTEQIDEDLEYPRLNKVSLNALTKTYWNMKKRFHETKQDFIRYRIVDNTLYQYFPEDEKFTKKEEAFEKALKTVLKLKKLPVIDFVFSNIDGLPSNKDQKDKSFYYENKKGFYLVDDNKYQAPIFTRAKGSDVKVGILIPDYYVLSELWPKMQKEVLKLNTEIDWDKKINCFHWRGASSKLFRFKLCELSLNHSDIVDAGFVEKMDDRKIRELKFWNKYDVYQKLKKNYASLEEQIHNKYLPVLDGVMCTYPGFHWRLLSNSVVLKQESIEKQWFYRALKPYEHYVPIKYDMSDLFHQITWAMQNDDKCKKIAKNASDFVMQNLMIEDVYVYLYKVLTEYSKYQAFDKKDLIKDLKQDKNWIAISNRRKANEILKKRKLL